jgi:hypothetical protein
MSQEPVEVILFKDPITILALNVNRPGMEKKFITMMTLQVNVSEHMSLQKTPILTIQII